MPRRHQVRMACQRCRRKRAKCDGEDPCERCKEAGLECLFDHSRRESKDDLRAEIERLRRTNERSDALLDALSSMDDADTYHMVAQGLMDGTVTRLSIYNDLPGHMRVSGAPLSISAGIIAQAIHGNSQATSSTDASVSDIRPSTCPHCSGALPSASATDDTYSDGFSGRTSERLRSVDTLSETNRITTTPGSGAGSVPSQLSTSGDENLHGAASWTRTGWSVAKVRDHLESLLTWDYLPFCLLCKDPFLRDFSSGEGRYCSRALVNSLLALSMQVLGEHPHACPQRRRSDQENHPVTAAEIGSFSSATSDSQALYEEAEALINGQGRPGSLPDIQALGMLALYQVSCGREAEARELSESFAAAMTELCLREPPAADKHGSQDALVRATTYCGAISLVRILKLLTAQPAGVHIAILQDDGVALDQPPCVYEPSNSPVQSMECKSLTAEHASQLSSLQLIPAKIFQLTEWVYKLLAASPSSSSPSPSRATTADEVVLTYYRCLDWYESFFAMLKTDGSNSPFVLFIHMYYQFCLLSLFRPHVSTPLEGLNAHPREISLQAAQSILALSQSYAGMFGLQHVSPLVPYFVCAAGLLSLAVEEAGHGMLGAVPMPPQLKDLGDEAALRMAESPEDAIKKESDDSAMDVEPEHGGTSSGGQRNRQLRRQSHIINMPAVAQARLLLSEMSAAHPVAQLAEGMLHRAPGRN
ncbi:hypothetical protein JDV02_008206 [Purpureocillium takamizusanense]|uniref:Zn(2)-C6 fungal-type domain-containing protein n=1 Tax=Purpureocillium takamizusanense TaxID=2060973 RepID=A0A9Q8QP38_9HYPO|nr:uncharacterized protein JDV02_008206 [Purpureocillium takamizusanense]UNI22306.1 hypothetical protein JDV02_008206 [Purpureocillium takamizusanense]